MTPVIEIREEQAGDLASIREVNRRAFGQDLEANIVDALRKNGAAQLSLAASVDGRIVGHIMFSPAGIGSVTGVALGPMAVLPELQRQGIGSRLVEAGIGELQRAGCPFIVVVGHPEFYLRFGFEPARSRDIRCEWNVPDEVFMVLVLDEARVRGLKGVATYRPEFSIE